MIEVIIRSEKGEGSSTVAHYLYWFLKLLGYNIKTNMVAPEKQNVENDFFSVGTLTKIKDAIIRTENYEIINGTKYYKTIRNSYRNNIE